MRKSWDDHRGEAIFGSPCIKQDIRNTHTHSNIQTNPQEDLSHTKCSLFMDRKHKSLRYLTGHQNGRLTIPGSPPDQMDHKPG